MVWASGRTNGVRLIVDGLGDTPLPTEFFANNNWQLRIADWLQRLESLAATPIKDFSEQRFEVGRVSTPFAGHNVSVDASAAFTVTPFTDRTNDDPDGILWPVRSGSGSLPTAGLFQAGNAWLKYDGHLELVLDHASLVALLPIPDDKALAGRALALGMPFRKDSAHESQRRGSGPIMHYGSTYSSNPSYQAGVLPNI